MKPYSISIICFLCLALLTGVLFAHKIEFTSDDLGRHLSNGKYLFSHPNLLYANFYSYTAPDFPFMNHHWLSGLVFYWVFKYLGGFEGLVVLKLLITVLTLSFLFRSCLISRAGPFLVSLFFLPAIFMWTERSELRPEILSYLLFAVYLFIFLKHRQGSSHKILYWLIPLHLLWVNLHIYFFLGFSLSGLFLIEEWVVSKKLKPLRRVSHLILLNLSLVLVSLINPHGLNGLLYPLRIFENYGYSVVENQSYFFMRTLSDDIHLRILPGILAILLSGFIVNFWVRWKRGLDRSNLPIALFGMAVLFSVLSLKAIRNFALLGLMLAPASSFNFAFLRKHQKIAFGLFFLSFALVFATAILDNAFRGKFVRAHSFGLGLEDEDLSSSHFFKENKLEGPIFNNYDSGSYLIFTLPSQEKVFIDNRPEAYPASFISARYKAMQEREDAWEQYSKEYNIKTIYFSHTDATPWARNFLISRLRDKEWPLIYADPYFVIMVRRDNPLSDQSINSNLTEYIRVKMNKVGLRQKLNFLNLLDLSGPTEDYVRILEELYESNKDNRDIEVSLGWKLTQSSNARNVERGVTYLKDAVNRGAKLPGIRNQLGVALVKLGRGEEARKIWRDILKDYPSDEQALDYLRQINDFIGPQSIPLPNGKQP